MCLLVHLAATITLTWRRFENDQVLVFLCFGWSMLAAMHIATSRPRLAHRLVAITFVALATMYWGADARFRLEAAIHAAAMVAILLTVGLIWRWTRYVTVSMSVAGAFGGTYVIAEGATGPAPAAALVSAGAFVSLILGATISWHKARLVKALQTLNRSSAESL